MIDWPSGLGLPPALALVCLVISLVAAFAGARYLAPPLRSRDEEDEER